MKVLLIRVVKSVPLPCFDNVVDFHPPGVEIRQIMKAGAHNTSAIWLPPLLL